MSLRFENIEKHRQNTVIVPNLTMSVPKSEVIAVHASIDARGHLLEILVGKDVSGGGEVYVDEVALRTRKNRYLSTLGISMLGEASYERMTVKDVFTFYKRLFQSDIEPLSAAKVMHLETNLKTKINDLSFSEKRRVVFSKLIFQDPSVIVMEEPEQNLDIESKRVLQQLLLSWKAEGKAVLLLMSNMESAITFADQVYRLTAQALTPVETKEAAAERTDEPEDTAAFSFSKIPTKVDDKIVLFDPPEIDYIESQDGKSIVYIKNEGFLCSFTLTELEEKLQSFGFFRCHRSYIVNLQKVREVITWTRNSYSLQLDDKHKSEIPLSKGKMEELKEMLGLK